MIAKRKAHLLVPHALPLCNSPTLLLFPMTITCIQFHCKAPNFLLPSHFPGSSSVFHSPRPNPSLRNTNSKSCRGTRISNRNIRGGVVCGVMFPVDPWAPNIDSQSIASQLFAASLFPYLGFLYFLTKSKTAPKLTLFGFYFLLAFVGATIPAGIYAKVNYGTSLANVDWLHGGAESLLTLTNIFIVLGLREALRGAKADEELSDPIPGSKEEKKTST